jgi:hypothetical protein
VFSDLRGAGSYAAEEAAIRQIIAAHDQKGGGGLVPAAYYAVRFCLPINQRQLFHSRPQTRPLLIDDDSRFGTHRESWQIGRCTNPFPLRPAFAARRETNGCVMGHAVQPRALAGIPAKLGQRCPQSFLLCGPGPLLALIAFLPWFWWAQTGWAASNATNGFQFSFSLKTPLLLFREFAGAGYWGSGLLLLLCAAALKGRCLHRRERVLLVLSISTVPVVVLCGDAWFGYFIAARQIIWILPAVAVLAAAAIECYPRTGLALAILLLIVCIRQSVTFFQSPSENWEMAANLLVDRVRQGTASRSLRPSKLLSTSSSVPN